MVFQKLPFGEPLVPKTATMRKIGAPQNTFTNKPCAKSENVQNLLQNGGEFFYLFDGLGSLFGYRLPKWFLEAPKAPKSTKIPKKYKEDATLYPDEDEAPGYRIPRYIPS